MEETKITKQDLNKVFWRSHLIQGSWNYERQMGLGYAWSMMPVLRKLYKEGSPEMSDALQRHLELFNTTPQCATFCLGLSASMEEENVKTKGNFPIQSINAVKASLMGPLAGIGDSFFWGTFKVIAAGLGVSLAANGSVIGPIASLVAYNLPSILVRYFGLKIGYKAGKYFLEKLSGGIMDKITFGASIVGLMVVGAMTASMIDLQFAWGYSKDVTVQSVLDSILPAALPLLATGICYWLIKKKISINWILIGIIIFGIIASYLGMFVV